MSLDAIDQDERRDHARASARGERLADLADAVVSALENNGLLREVRQARLVTFHMLAELLYSGRAVDIPARLDASATEGVR